MRRLRYLFRLLFIFDLVALLTLKHTNRSNPPWLTSFVCTFICLKRQTFNKYVNTNRNSDYLKFEKLRNMCAAAVRFEKNAYLNSLSHVSSRYFWQRLSELGDYKSATNVVPKCLFDSDHVNNYFIDFLPTSSCSSTVLQNFLDFSPITSNSFQFNSITLSHLYSIMKNIKLTSAGLFDLSGHIVVTFICLSWSFVTYIEFMCYMSYV